MKVAITAKKNNLESEIDPRFGRCSYFLIIDLDSMNFESISNKSAMTSGGAGIQAAQTISKTGVKVLLTGNIGPNAFQTLSAAGIKVFTGAYGNIKDALNKFKNGELKQSEDASVRSHFGMSGSNKDLGGI